MSEHNQEGYQTLEWIINKSENGLFLVIANENIQSEIVEVYRQGVVGIYDYGQYPEAYSFQKLKHWIDSVSEIQTIFIVNFQFAVQNEEDLKRLNFSRDMLTGLKKNLIFLTTPYGDDNLALSAYDFYSFIKIRIIFHDDKVERNEWKLELTSEKDESLQGEWSQEEAKKKLNETNILIRQAKELADKACYQESINLLLKAKEIREKLLGSKHLEMVTVYHELAEVYEQLGAYEKAEELYRKTLKICKEVWGKNHPDTATSYNNLANLYRKQGKYKEAEELDSQHYHFVIK